MYASYEVGPSWFATSPGVSPDSPPAFGTKPRPELPDDLPVKRTRNRASIPAARNSEAARTPVRALVIDSPLVACPSGAGQRPLVHTARAVGAGTLIDGPTSGVKQQPLSGAF